VALTAFLILIWLAEILHAGKSIRHSE